MSTAADRSRLAAPRRVALPNSIAAPRGLALAVILVVAGAWALAAQAAKPPVAKPPATPSTSAPAAPDTTALARRVIAYYFHTDYRCATCRKLEAYSHAAIQAAFANELATGRLVWRLVNVEEKGNEHFVKDYELYTKALVVVDETNGRQVRWKNLEKIWELVTQQEKFYGYVQDEVRGYLAAAP